MSRAWPPHPEQLSAMTQASLPAGGPHPAAASSTSSGDPGSDSDPDHPMQEPEFEIHAVDDDRRGARRAPLPPRPLLPVQQHLPPQIAHAADERREADRIERLHYFMFAPQGVLCSWTLVLGSVMIYHAKHPDMLPDLTLDLMVACSVLVMLFSLLSLVLSYLGIYVYDRCPGLNHWLHHV